MKVLSGVTIGFSGREYALAFTRGASGANWLMLMNRKSGAVLPATAIEPRPSSVDEVHVYQADGLHEVLRSAGIVTMGKPSESSLGLAVRKCQIVHSGLVAELALLQASLDQAQAKEAAAKIQEMRTGRSPALELLMNSAARDASLISETDRDTENSRDR